MFLNNDLMMNDVISFTGRLLTTTDILCFVNVVHNIKLYLIIDPGFISSFLFLF